MKYFLSLAVGPYRDAGYRIALEARQLGIFDSVRVVTDWEGDVRNWHAVLIDKTMRTMVDGDILFVANAGCKIINDPISWQTVIDALETKNIVAFRTKKIERCHAKGDLFGHLKLDLASQVAFDGQISTAITAWRCGVTSLHFLRQWVDLMKITSLYDDTHSVAPNWIEFENPSADSVFSLLVKKDPRVAQIFDGHTLVNTDKKDLSGPPY